MNSNIRRQYLQQMGIQTWLLKSNADVLYEDNTLIEQKAIEQNPQCLQDDNHPQLADNTEKQTGTIAQIKISSNEVPGEEIAKPSIQTAVQILESKVATFHTFDSCQLCESRKNHLEVLSGDGYADADVFFICEAPNADEERAGHYLTGEVQSLFNKMLNTIAIKNNYFFTGLVKCHSFENYLLSEDDIKNCQQHLNQQLEEFKPKIIVLLGTTQAQAILKTEQSVHELRNKVHSIEINHQTYQAIVSYHPAFLLRNPLYKKEALQDLILIKSLIKHELN